MRLNCLIVFLALTTGLSGGETTRLRAVTFNTIRDGGRLCGNDMLETYSVVVDNFWPNEKYVRNVLKSLTHAQWLDDNRNKYTPLDDRFPESLAKAQLFYIGQYTHDTAAIPFQLYPEAIQGFLKNGGTVFFDYFSATPELNDFLASVNVTNPTTKYGDLKPGGYLAVPWGDKLQSLFTRPNALINKELRSYGWWERWPETSLAPFRSSEQPESRAAMIIHENVHGCGQIIFNQMPHAFRTPKESGDKILLENILSYIFKRNIVKYKEEIKASKGGPGEPAF